MYGNFDRAEDIDFGDDEMLSEEHILFRKERKMRKFNTSRKVIRFRIMTEILSASTFSSFLRFQSSKDSQWMHQPTVSEESL